MRKINSKLKTQNSKLGFTLIELMIVMGIVAVLAGAVAFISVPKNLQRGRDGRRQTDLEAIRSALEIYRSDNSAYPLTANWKTSLSPTYMTTVPTDPKTNGDYSYTKGPVVCNGVSVAYCLCATLEITIPPAYCVTNP